MDLDLKANKLDPTVPVRRLFYDVIDEDSGDSDELPNYESVCSRIKCAAHTNNNQ